MTLLKKWAAVALMLSASTAMAHEYKVGELEIDHPWSRALPPVATVGVAYFDIDNQGEQDEVLLGAESPVAKTVEIHNHINEDGVMKMSQIDELTIPAKGKQSLAPGGYHLMLMDLNKVPAAGEHFPLTLHFKQAGTVEVEVAVEAQDDDKKHDEHHHH